MRLLLNAICTSLVIGTVSGQIDLVGQSPGIELTTLENAGNKLFRVHTGVLSIYNLDLTLYASMPLPPTPAGYYTNKLVYITEDLFDTDPTSIEFAIIWAHSNDPNLSGFEVFRDDGTVVFSAFPGNLIWYFGMNDTNPIFNTADGTFMVLHTGEGVYGWDLYRLPGHLPCKDCSGSQGALSIGGPSPLSFGQIIAQPNPTNNNVEIRYQLPSGTDRADLIFLDAGGKEVLRAHVDRSGVFHTPSDLPSGTYLCQLLTLQGTIATTRVVISR